MEQLRKEGVPEANLEEAANHLVGQQLSEGANLDPKLSHDQGTGTGIYGARKDRRSRMFEWMEKNGYPRDSLEGQSAYMAHEAMTDKRFKPTRDALMGASAATRSRDADIITRNFEAPKVANDRSGNVARAARIPADAAGGAPTGATGGGADTTRKGASLQGVDPRLVEAIREGSKQLPEGYTMRPTSGLRPGDRGFHGRGKASDWQIYDPQGKPLPNRGWGEAETKMHADVARGAYGHLLKTNPELAGRFAWGGAFPTGKGGSGPPDLMHYDFGGRRGRWSDRHVQAMGPLYPPTDKGQATTVATGSEGKKPYVDIGAANIEGEGKPEQGPPMPGAEQLDQMRQQRGELEKPIKLNFESDLNSGQFVRHTIRRNVDRELREARYSESLADIGAA